MTDLKQLAEEALRQSEKMRVQWGDQAYTPVYCPDLEALARGYLALLAERERLAAFIDQQKVHFGWEIKYRNAAEQRAERAEAQRDVLLAVAEKSALLSEMVREWSHCPNKVTFERIRQVWLECDAALAAARAKGALSGEPCNHNFQPESRTWEVCTKCGARQ